MGRTAYTRHVHSLDPELGAIERAGEGGPDGDDQMASWVALCLSALGEVGEEMQTGDHHELGRAADAREVMLRGARLALDGLEEVCGVARTSAIRELTDRLAAAGEFDDLGPDSLEDELDAAREAAVYELSLAAQAAVELGDPELRHEYFGRGLAGFAAVAVSFARSLRRLASAPQAG